ncbi:TIR domain-containing protein [Roseivirga sp. BDSF3-8]|uniref:TIR domain-containing protein n=1 Tax=Roseivirga sp. BDSF3-8 TaxID=3241598 RepID=UPI003531DECB
MQSTEYDIVISFSEDQRDIAVGIKLALDAINISAYYYCYDPEVNLGINLKQNLYNVYRNSGHLAICIFSEDYFKKEYTLVELKAVLDRSKAEPDYMFPVRTNNIKLPEVFNGVTYFDWNKDPKAIAQIARQRLNKKSTTFLESDAKRIALKDKQSLLNAISRYSSINSNSADFYYSLGLHYYYLNLSPDDQIKAAKNFHKAFSLNPSFHQAMYFYSRAKIQAVGIDRIKYSQIKDPVGILIRAIAMQPNNIEYYNWASLINQNFYSKHGLISPLITIV